MTPNQSEQYNAPDDPCSFVYCLIPPPAPPALLSRPGRRLTLRKIFNFKRTRRRRLYCSIDYRVIVFGPAKKTSHTVSSRMAYNETATYGLSAENRTQLIFCLFFKTPITEEPFIS